LPLIAGKDAILVVYNGLSKIAYFVATTKETLVKGLVRLFRNNVWKLHRLLKSMILDRKLQFSAKLTKELNKILGIEIKLPILFYLQTGGQTEQMNQKLEQYLYFFVDYKQNN